MSPRAGADPGAEAPGVAGWCAEPPPPRLLEGVALFNRGEFFEQHEILEDLWRDEPRPVRRLYQGILQVGVAAYHVRRGNRRGALKMLAAGTEHLRAFPATCQTVDVAGLLEQASRLRAAIQRLGADGLRDLDPALVPRVRLTVKSPGPAPGLSPGGAPGFRVARSR